MANVFPTTPNHLTHRTGDRHPVPSEGETMNAAQPDLTEATREWHTRRPELIAQWKAEAVAMAAPYRATETEVRNYVRRQESLWWHRKRLAAKAN
jgi:hypothetical protein